MMMDGLGKMRYQPLKMSDVRRTQKICHVIYLQGRKLRSDLIRRIVMVYNLNSKCA